ncbi:helicase RepA family protein [Sulfuriferula nivalis]|uniref:helicase RepA family protein n=1 Tax=Sulfuriferula nivalis TaxID=2675298 RepID=UPI00138987BB|nr:helicase RepA family protein [Sulfuriferula nivalis]
MRLKTLDLCWALQPNLPLLDFVLPGLLAGSVGLLVASGGTGKSFLALDIAISQVIGRPVADGLFPSTNQHKVVYLAGEESDRLLAERLRCMLTKRERELPTLQNLILLAMSGNDCLLVSRGQPTSLLNELENVAQGARLIILDPIRRLHDGDENDSAAMTQFVIALESLAKKTGAAVIGLHHTNRASVEDASSQHASRGSSALVDGARWQINLSTMNEKTAAVCGKSNEDRHNFVALDFVKGNYFSPRPRSWLKRDPNGSLKLVTLNKSQPKGKTVGGAHLIF